MESLLFLLLSLFGVTYTEHANQVNHQAENSAYYQTQFGENGIITVVDDLEDF